MLCPTWPCSTRDGTDANATARICSLLTSLRKLTLNDVAVSLPSLQPVATRLHELDLFNCRLQDSADGFLTKGWTTLTTLSLIHTLVENATMAAELELPALEELDISGFRHQGGVLQPDQLTGSCPNIRGLRFQLDSDVAQDREGRGLCCRLLELGGFADLYMCIGNEHLRVDLDLPASVTLFVIDGLDNATVVDLSWALREAAKCISRGAQLRRLECYPAHACVQGAQWAGSLDEQYRQLGAQLSSLRELEVCGGSQQLLSALCAVVSSAPHLTHANLTITRWPPRKGFSPIRSASLESISVTILEPSKKVPCPLLVLIFLPGCTRLQKVLVQLPCEDLTEGTAVKIRCHRGSPNCIVPLDAHACAAEYRLVHGYDSCVSELGVDFLPEPASLQHVSAYTVLNACHAAGLQQPLKWGHHVVMPGIL